MSGEHGTVSLSASQTCIDCDEETKRLAIGVAFRITMSTCEWTWTDEEAANMANYLLWAHQRLSAIDQCVNRDLVHQS